MTRVSGRSSMWSRGGAAAHKELCITNDAGARRALNGLALALALGVELLFGSGMAQAHGEAEWIRLMQLGCCGPSDCARVPDGTWTRQQHGYLHNSTGEFISHAEVKASVDGHFWECRTGSGKVRTVIAKEGGMCLFVPAIGF